MDALHSRFTQRVRRLMVKKGLTLNRLADFANVGRGRLSEILAGKSSPTLRTLGRLSDALDVSPADLLRDDPDAT